MCTKLVHYSPKQDIYEEGCLRTKQVGVKKLYTPLNYIKSANRESANHENKLVKYAIRLGAIITFPIVFLEKLVPDEYTRLTFKKSDKSHSSEELSPHGRLVHYNHGSVIFELNKEENIREKISQGELEERLIEIWHNSNAELKKPDLIEIDKIIPYLNSGSCVEYPIPNILRGYMLHSNS